MEKSSSSPNSILHQVRRAARPALRIYKVRVSKFWLWFVIAFAVICVIPFWPHKDGSLLPFATPYVNFGLQISDLFLLAIHLSIALAVATMIHWKEPKLRALWMRLSGRQ